MNCDLYDRYIVGNIYIYIFIFICYVYIYLCVTVEGGLSCSLNDNVLFFLLLNAADTAFPDFTQTKLYNCCYKLTFL